MITRFHIISILYFLILGLSWWTKNHLFFIAPALAILYLGIEQFIIDKRFYKNLRNAVRKDIPIWRILVGIASFFIFAFFPLQIFNFEAPTGFYVLISFVGFFMAFHFQRHTNSFRSFPEGLMLPGKDGELIPWKDIREFTIEGETVTLLRNFERSSFEFDRRDSSQMIEIVKTWETTSHNRNRTIDDSLTVEK